MRGVRSSVGLCFPNRGNEVFHFGLPCHFFVQLTTNHQNNKMIGSSSNYNNVVDGSKPYIVEDRPMISRSSGDRGECRINDSVWRVVFDSKLDFRFINDVIIRRTTIANKSR